MPSISILGTRGYPSYYGGFETLVRYLSPYLADHGWDVTVFGRSGAVHYDDPQRDHRVKSLESWGIQSKSLSTLTYGLSSALKASASRPDVALVLNVANGFWLPLLRAQGVPTIVNVDGIEWEREKWGRLAKLVFRAGARSTAKYADDLVFDSRVIEARWEREFHRHGNFIAYGGDVVLDAQHPFVCNLGSYILIVARFVPENTVRQFLEAVPDLSQSHSVVIVGSSGFGGELDELASRLDSDHENVHWLGHVSDDGLLHALWANAAAYFHGHSVGGTNPALVQAMACGAPVVARDTPYNREVLGEEGCFVEPNVTSIKEALVRVASSKEEQSKLGHDAHLRAQEMYSWAKICESYRQALVELI